MAGNLRSNCIWLAAIAIVPVLRHPESSNCLPFFVVMRPGQLDVQLQKLLDKGLPGNQKTTWQESKLVSISEPIKLSEFSRMRFVPRPKAPMLLQSIVPPGKYSDQVAEREFLQEFRTVGLQFTVYAFILGCLLTITGYVLIAARLANVPINDTQFVRILILAFLSLSICVFLWASDFTLTALQAGCGCSALVCRPFAWIYGFSLRVEPSRVFASAIDGSCNCNLAHVWIY